MTDFNALFENAVKEAVAQKEDEIKAALLKEDHDAIHALLDKKVNVYSENLIKLFGANKVTGDAADQIYTHLFNFYKEADAAVDGKDKYIPFTAGTAEKIETGHRYQRQLEKQIVVDNENRIIIKKDVLNETDLPFLTGVVKILQERGDVKKFYIVDRDFKFDKKRFDVVKERTLDGNFRIGVGGLLNAEAGDVIGVDAYYDQLVVYKTGTNVNATKIERPVPTGRKFVREVTVDNEGRIRITAEILDGTDFPFTGTLKLLKDEDTNELYIVPEDTYDYKKTFIKTRYVDEGSFRIGVGTLLNAKAGDIIGVDVYEDKLVLYNTDTNVKATTKTATTKDTRDIDAIKNVLKKFGIKAKSVKELVNKNGKNFAFRAFTIDI